MKNSLIIAKREITSRVSSKVFITSTLVMAVTLGIMVFIYSKIGSSGSSGTSDLLGENARETLNASLQAKSEVLQNLGSTPEQFDSEVAARAADIVSGLGLADSAAVANTMLMGIIVAMLLYIAMQMTGSQIALGVVEEKSSRVVEILLASMSSFELLVGKVIGIGVCGLIQVGVTLGVTLITANFSGGSALFAGVNSGELGVAMLAFFAVGYFSYACIYAAFASTVSRVEEVNQAITPVMLLMMFPFFGTIIPSLADSPAIIFLLKFCPFVSPISMPSLFAKGAATLTEVVISLGISAATIPLVLWFAAKLYDRSILHTGEKLKILAVLKK